MFRKIFTIIATVALLLASASPVQASLSSYWGERGEKFIPCSQERFELAAQYAVFDYKCDKEGNQLLEERLRQDDSFVGAAVATGYKSTLDSSMTSSQTTISPVSLSLPDGVTLTMALVDNEIFLVVEPGGAREEIIRCTAISSGDFSSCTRGLAFSGSSFTSVTANQKVHRAGSSVVMSNVHYIYENFVDKDSSETVSGTKRFADNTFILGDGTGTGSKKIYFCDTIATSTCGYFAATPSSTLPGFLDFSFSGDGTSSITLNSNGTVVAASSTKGAFLTNGYLGVVASSTRGFDFDTNGELYLKDGSNSGIYFDSNGIAVERYDTYNWEGAHKFGANLNVSSTFQSTQPLTVFSTTASSTLPKIATDFISATTTGANVTTTVVNNLQINGDIGATGQNYAKSLIKVGQGSQAANTTGNQVVTHNLNFTPSLIKIYANAHNMGTGADIGISSGSATTASDESCTYLSHVSTSGSGTSASGQTSSIICLYDSPGNAYARATLDAVTATTFTLNWVTNGANGSSRYYQWEVYR